MNQVLMTGASVLNMEAGETPAQPGAIRHWMESFFQFWEPMAGPGA